jgi:hypothetical protein
MYNCYLLLFTSLPSSTGLGFFLCCCTIYINYLSWPVPAPYTYCLKNVYVCIYYGMAVYMCSSYGPSPSPPYGEPLGFVHFLSHCDHSYTRVLWRDNRLLILRRLLCSAVCWKKKASLPCDCIFVFNTMQYYALIHGSSAICYMCSSGFYITKHMYAFMSLLYVNICICTCGVLSGICINVLFLSSCPCMDMIWIVCSCMHSETYNITLHIYLPWLVPTPHYYYFTFFFCSYFYCVSCILLFCIFCL